SGSGHNHCHHLLAKVGVWQAEHRHFGDGWVLRQHVLDLAWVHIIATADDKLARPPRDCVVAIGAAPAQIARLEPAIGAERLCRSVGTPPVPREDRGPAPLALAALARRQRLAAHYIHHPSLLAGERPTDGPWPPLALIRIGQVHDRLGHAVTLENT